jgi:hypothetical protein
MNVLTGITIWVRGSLRKQMMRPALGIAVLIGAALGTLGSTGVAEAATMVTNPTITITPPSSAAGATTDYTVGFKTSSTGSLASSDVINVSLPAATGLNNLNGNSGVFVGTTQVGNCFNNSTTGPPPTTAVQCQIFGGDSIGASTVVSVIIAGVVNPTAGSYTLKVSTSSDTSLVTSPSYTVTAAKSVSSPTISISPPSSAAGATTDYTLGFTTSSTGALSGTATSVINVSLPAATGLNNLNGNSGVFVGTTQVGNCFNNSTTSPPTTAVQCQIFGGDSVGASTAATVVIAGVVNPTAGGYTLSFSTSSDTTAVTSPSYTVTAAKSVSPSSLSLSNFKKSASGVTYTLGFMTSSTGALSGTAASVINVSLPAATGLNNLNGNSGVFVGTTQVGNCFNNSTTSPPTTAVQCQIFGGDSVGASAAATVVLAGVVNPGVGTYQLSISTSSDVTTVNSPSYTITSPPKITSFTPTSGPVGKKVTITGKKLGGATNVSFNGHSATIVSNTATTIVAKVPTGATSGKISVTTAGGTGTSATSFTVT